MNFLRAKDVGVKCNNPKCFGVNDKLIRCRCSLKNPKKFPCKEKHKYALYYVYDLEIEWVKCELETNEYTCSSDICVFADIDLTENPFKHSVCDLWDKYYNLSLAKQIEIIGPHWRKYHINKYGTPHDECFCDENCEGVEEEDFKQV